MQRWIAALSAPPPPPTAARLRYTAALDVLNELGEDGFEAAAAFGGANPSDAVVTEAAPPPPEAAPAPERATSPVVDALAADGGGTPAAAPAARREGEWGDDEKATFLDWSLSGGWGDWFGLSTKMMGSRSNLQIRDFAVVFTQRNSVAAATLKAKAARRALAALGVADAEVAALSAAQLPEALAEAEARAALAALGFDAAEIAELSAAELPEALAEAKERAALTALGVADATVAELSAAQLPEALAEAEARAAAAKAAKREAKANGAAEGPKSHSKFSGMTTTAALQYAGDRFGIGREGGLGYVMTEKRAHFKPFSTGTRARPRA
ncbi:hypothetical protein JL720_2041 [Aureococcus anophagefferens]|nr:hypothetical protein JL720_2041 [Aureococcus anophagefferens]